MATENKRAPVLTGEMSMELCPLYLEEIGAQTFMGKLETHTFGAGDVSQVYDFLVRHDVEPTKDNAFRLTMGAHFRLFIAKALAEHIDDEPCDCLGCRIRQAHEEGYTCHELADSMARQIVQRMNKDVSA